MGSGGTEWEALDTISRQRLNQKTVYIYDSEPAITYAGQVWFDTSVDLLKVRNADNDDWITVGSGGSYITSVDANFTVTDGELILNVPANNYITSVDSDLFVVTDGQLLLKNTFWQKSSGSLIVAGNISSAYGYCKGVAGIVTDYLTGAYGVTWGSLPEFPTGVNGMHIMLYNTDLAESRIYIYSNGAWTFFRSNLNVYAAPNISPTIGINNTSFIPFDVSPYITITDTDFPTNDLSPTIDISAVKTP